MSNWNESNFYKIMYPGTNFAVVVGKPLTGKTTVSNLLAKHLNFKLIDFKVVEEEVKKSMAGEDEAFDGEVSVS